MCPFKAIGSLVTQKLSPEPLMGPKLVISWNIVVLKGIKKGKN